MRLSQKDRDVIQALSDASAPNARMTVKQILEFDNVSRSSVYAVLGDLERRGLVDATLAPPTYDAMPSGRLYALTNAGWRALATF